MPPPGCAHASGQPDFAPTIAFFLMFDEGEVGFKGSKPSQDYSLCLTCLKTGAATMDRHSGLCVHPVVPETEGYAERLCVQGGVGT